MELQKEPGGQRQDVRPSSLGPSVLQHDDFARALDFRKCGSLERDRPQDRIDDTTVLSERIKTFSQFMTAPQKTNKNGFIAFAFIAALATISIRFVVRPQAELKSLLYAASPAFIMINRTIAGIGWFYFVLLSASFPVRLDRTRRRLAYTFRGTKVFHLRLRTQNRLEKCRGCLQPFFFFW